MITGGGEQAYCGDAASGGIDYPCKLFTAGELTRNIQKQLNCLGYDPPSQARTTTANRNMGFSSVDVLTGGVQKT